MRHLLLIACVSVGCSASGGGDDDVGPDAGLIGQSCPMPLATADAGALTASKAQMCNVSGSMGASHWYKLAAALPGSMNYIQIELWDNTGVFAGGVVHPGTFKLTGNEVDFTRCGVCVRALGDKGAAGQKEYFATGGTVNVTAVGANGQPISATLSDLSFAEIDATTHQLVAGGCSATVAGAELDGTVVQLGGGGGGGGAGAGQCAPGIGD